MFLLSALLMVLVSSSPSSAGSLGTALQERPAPEPLASLLSRLAESLTGALHFIGGLVPLRGVASLAADLGVPGAAAIMEALTPSSGRHPRHLLKSDSTAAHRQVEGEKQGFAQKTSSYFHGPYRDEVLSLVGAFLGEQECLLKLACLSGKKVSAISGGSAATIMLSAASNIMPRSLRRSYYALRDSLIYSDDCTQYLCTAA